MADYEEFLEEAEIRYTKWLNHTHTRNGSWPYPVLLFNAKERDASHISKARCTMRDSAAYRNASIADAQNMLTGAVDQARQETFQHGNGFRMLALKFGHQQVNGKFLWKNTAGSKNFDHRSCFICGIDHDPKTCPWWFSEYEKNKGHPHPRLPASIDPGPAYDAGSYPSPVSTSVTSRNSEARTPSPRPSKARKSKSHISPSSTSTSCASKARTPSPHTSRERKSKSRTSKQHASTAAALISASQPVPNFDLNTNPELFSVEGTFCGLARRNDDGSFTIQMSDIEGTAFGQSGFHSFAVNPTQVEGGYFDEPAMRGQEQESDEYNVSRAVEYQIDHGTVEGNFTGVESEASTDVEEDISHLIDPRLL